MQAKINGVTIHYETLGEGPAMVCVHGLGGTSNIWHAQRVTLSKYYKVVTYDLSGSGRSERARREYSIEGWADELAGLLDHLQIAQAVVMGHSMGTVIAQKFAAKYPQKTTALVVAGGLVEFNEATKEVFRQRAAMAETEGMVPVADEVLAAGLSAGSREKNLALTGMVREMLAANDPQCYAAHCRALIAGSAKEDQPKITCPTLVIVGDQDTVTPLVLTLRIARAIKKSQIRIVPETAHMTMLEAPGAFNAAVLEFLAGVWAAGAST